MDKPQCCEDEMSFLMDNKVRAAFQCLHCGDLVVRDKRTGEETWFSPKKRRGGEIEKKS